MRVSDSYPSLVQGVSEQPPETRGPGRMGEQINVLPDLVHRLTRRHGTRFVAEQTVPVLHDLAVADTARVRTLTFSNGVDDIDLMYNPAAEGPSGITPVIAFNRTTNAFMTYTRNPVDDVLSEWERQGVSAITPLGKYVITAANDYPVEYSSTDTWDVDDNKFKTTVWVRNGAFSRTFTLKVRLSSGVEYSVSHTTPSASYTGVLDTSDIPAFVRETPAAVSTDIELAFPERLEVAPPWGSGTSVWRARLAYGKFDPTITAMSETTPSATTALTNSYPAAPSSTQYYHAPNGEFVYFHPVNLDLFNGDFDSIWYSVTYTHAKVKANDNYTRIVNDMTASYNTAVTQWLSTSTEGISPDVIAQEINTKLVAAGVTSGVVSGSTIRFNNVEWAEVTDGGDGTLIRVTSNTVKAAEDLTASHFNGKVVRVQAQANAESYYLKAVTDNGDTFGTVTWVESGRYSRGITSGLVMLYPVGGVLYAASSAALMSVLVAGDHPSMVTNQIGDDTSNPNPHFFGRGINYLGVFQDRLLVGSGGTITASRTGDYFNFFRSTVVTIPASDAYSMRAEGPDDDSIRFSCVYNRDLILFGSKRQYLIPGRVAMTPLSANMPVLSSHQDANPVPPVDAGGLVFYTTVVNGVSAVSQMEPTLNIDSPSTFSVSTQLDTYITGAVTEMTPLAKPLSLLVRTNDARDTLFVFKYLDSTQGRKQDAWFKLTFDAALGALIGVGYKGAATYLYFLRQHNGTTWVVCDRLILDGGLSSYPYLDSLRPVTDMDGSTSVTGVSAPWRLAVGSGDNFLRGGNVSSRAIVEGYGGQVYVGCEYDALVEVTNPVILDNNGNVVTTGELVVSTLTVSTKDSSGLTYTVAGTAVNTYTVSGTSVGGSPFGVPIVDQKYDLPIYENTHNLTITLAARKWYPFTVTALDWTGQYFNRTPRR